MPASSKKSANTVINLLILLNTKGGAVAREEACRVLGVRDGALDEALDIINSLANRESGARAVVVDDGETLTRLGCFLVGGAASFDAKRPFSWPRFA